jgi:hypothetical protein
MVLSAGTKFGRYEIRTQIGEGGITHRKSLSLSKLCRVRRGRGISRAHRLVTSKDLPGQAGRAVAGDERTARSRLDQ